jgi:hypothetical protein
VDVHEEFVTLHELAAPAARFGHHRLNDGTEIYGYWPAKPGHSALNDRFEVAWLRHIFFPPLTLSQLTLLEAQVGRSLPRGLSVWLTNCSNGLSLASGELDMYGLQLHIDRAALAPHVYDLAIGRRDKTPRDADDHVFVFGGWGDVQPLWIDERSGTVHASTSESLEPIRSWRSIGAMLIAEMRRGSALFDGEGQRIPASE